MDVTSSVDIENIQYEDGCYTVQARAGHLLGGASTDACTMPAAYRAACTRSLEMPCLTSSCAQRLPLLFVDQTVHLMLCLLCRAAC